ncbi:MAG: peptidylprolyl isomerase [Bellilinea sp.]|jgi:parvulin-like peptidyl-prolyl isomerase
MAKAPRPTVVSRKQQSRVEREKQQRRALLITSITLAVMVVGILGYGLLDTLYLQNLRPVAAVEDEKITLQQFQERARFTRFQLIQNTIQLVQYQQLFGGDPNSGGFFDAQIQSNIATLDDPTALGNRVIEEMVNEIVIRKEAERLGITVTEAEVDQALQEVFGYFPAGTPTPAATATAFATATYSAQQLTLAPSTPTPTEAPTPTLAPSPTPDEALPTATIAATATVGPTPTPFPTATPMTAEGFEAALDEYLQTLQDQVDFSSASFRNIVRASLLYEKVYEAITQDVPREDDWVWARHILVATPEEAAIVIEALNDNQDFAALAAQYSTDTSNNMRGGDLGWFERGQMVSEFDNVVFSMTEIGAISEPVQTQFGYHVIQFLGRESRPVSANRLSTLQQEKFDAWLEEIKTGMTIEINANWTDKVPTIPTLPPGLGS